MFNTTLRPFISADDYWHTGRYVDFVLMFTRTKAMPKLWVDGILHYISKTSLRRQLLESLFGIFGRCSFHKAFNVYDRTMCGNAKFLLRHFNAELPTKMLIKLYWFNEVITYNWLNVVYSHICLLHLADWIASKFKASTTIKFYRYYWHSTNAFRIGHFMEMVRSHLISQFDYIESHFKAFISIIYHF